MVKIQIDRDALRASIHHMINDGVDLALDAVNKKNAEQIQSEEDFKAAFFEEFHQVAEETFPKGLMDALSIDFDFSINLKEHQVAIDFDFYPKEDNTDK